MTRFHTASEYFFATGPLVFHSFCNLVSASSADEPCDDAERHITVCDLEDGLCLEENAGTDDNANNHANCGEKAVFAFQFVIHENTSFLKPEMSGANTKRTVEQRDQRTAAWRWKGNRSQRK